MVLVAAYEQLARRALPAYGFDPAAELVLIGLSENATYRVHDPSDGRVAALRVHRSGYHSQQAISSELAWLTALRGEAGISTPAVYPTLEGQPVLELADDAYGPRHAALFELLAGTEPPEDQLLDRLEELGELCARMHLHTRSWTRPEGFVRFRWDFDACLGSESRWGRWQDGIGVGPAEREVIGRAVDTLEHRLARLGDGAERFGLIHADVRLSNLLVDGAAMHIIDFDDCGFGWYLYDLASALSFIEHRPDVAELCDAWLRGYRSLLSVSASDEADIPTLIVLRRLLLVAWVGSHRFADTARTLGAEFTADTCVLAEEYLARFG